MLNSMNLAKLIVVQHSSSNLELAPANEHMYFLFGLTFPRPLNHTFKCAKASSDENELYFMFPRCLFLVDCKCL